MSKYVAEYRTLATPFDIVLEGETPGDDPERLAAGLEAVPLAGEGVDSCKISNDPNATDGILGKWKQVARDTALLDCFLFFS